jgi:hypothetical protein
MERAMTEPGDELVYYNVSRIAKRWACSEDKVSRVLEKYRGRAGFMDLAGGTLVRRKRRYSIIRIHPSLLKEIEAKH